LLPGRLLGSLWVVCISSGRGTPQQPKQQQQIRLMSRARSA
jgi:hypothetical protein